MSLWTSIGKMALLSAFKTHHLIQTFKLLRLIRSRTSSRLISGSLRVSRSIAEEPTAMIIGIHVSFSHFWGEFLAMRHLVSHFTAIMTRDNDLLAEFGIVIGRGGQLKSRMSVFAFRSGGTKTGEVI